MVATSVSPDQRHKRRNPCGVCGGHADMPQGKGIRCAGFDSEDGRYCHCTREEYAGDIQATTDAEPPTYAHFMEGPCRCGKTHGPAPIRAEPPRRPARRLPPRVTRYELRDADGTLAGIHVRRDYLDSEGRPYRDKGPMPWEQHNGRGAAEMPLYGLLAHLAAPADALRIICEGEKATDALNEAVKRAGRTDVIAVGTVTGAPSFPCDASLQPLVGFPIATWADNDDVGRLQMKGVAQRFIAWGAPVPKWFDWPEAPEKGDAADYFAAGGTVEGMLQLVTDQRRPENDADEDDGPILPGEVERFPIEVFPELLRNLLTEGAKAFPCPPDLIGVPLLALLGAAIGNSCHLEIKRTWHEAPILWTAAIAPPGAKKTPVLKMLRACWDRRQREFIKQYEAERAEWEQTTQEARDAAKKGSATSPPGPEPVLRQAYVSDTTMEALSDALIVNERGVALIRDELDGWVRSMNQYKDGKGSDRQNWLSLWSGESYPLNRRNRHRPAFVSDPFVGITGGIQPDILTDLNDERGHQDGFIHRILFAYPDVLPIKGFTEDEVAKDTLDALEDIFAKLWTLQLEAEEDGRTHPVLLHFTPAGRKVWREWTEAHADEQNDPAFPAVLSGPWQKMLAYAARCALIIHRTRWAAGEHVSHDVDEHSMAAGAELVDYFKAHARRVYALLHTSEEDKRILAAVEWIRKQPGRTTTARAILRCHVGGVKTADDAKALLNKLAEHKYGMVREVSSGHGKASLTFTLTAKDAPRTADNDATGDNTPPPQAGRAA